MFILTNFNRSLTWFWHVFLQPSVSCRKMIGFYQLNWSVSIVVWLVTIWDCSQHHVYCSYFEGCEVIATLAYLIMYVCALRPFARSSRPRIEWTDVQSPELVCNLHLYARAIGHSFRVWCWRDADRMRRCLQIRGWTGFWAYRDLDNCLGIGWGRCQLGLFS